MRVGWAEGVRAAGTADRGGQAKSLVILRS